MQRLGLLLALGLVGAGCPAVVPRDVEPVLLAPGAGPVLRLEAELAAPLPEPVAFLARLRERFAAHRVHAYRVTVGKKSVAVRKVLVNPPGLLRDLELNRFVANFLRALAGGKTVAFFRADALEATSDFPALLRRGLRGPISWEPGRSAVAIYDEVTPLWHRFRAAALQLPLSQVHFTYRADASTLTLQVRDPAAVRALTERLGWGELTPEKSGFAERAAEERRIYVAVGGVVLMEDVIRPGAQLVRGPDGRAVWEFNASVSRGDWAWASALLQRRHVVRRYSLQLAADL